MKKKIFLALSSILFAMLFFVPTLAAQAADVMPVMDQVKAFLNAYYLTEAAFMAMTISITQFILKIFGAIVDNRIKQLISLLITFLAGVIGFVLHIGIFAEMGLIDLVIFVFMKTFAGNGFFTWIKAWITKKT